MNKDKPDLINHPPHYTAGGIEIVDFLESRGLDKDHYLANAVEYITRSKLKGDPVSDIKKAVWYLERWLKVNGEK